MARPLFDTVADFTAGPPNVPGVNAVSLNTAGTLTQAWSIRRGRQYELDNAEAGMLSVALFDPKENANPVNATSPWNSGSNKLLPYRCIQRAAFWNSTSLNTAGNILNSANTPPGSTAAYDPSFETSVAWLTNFSTAAAVAQSTTQAFNGTHSAAVTLTASADRDGAVLWTVPNQVYTLSVYVFVPATYAVTLSFGQYSPTVTTYSTAASTTTGAWQRLTVTATATNAVSYFQLKASTAPAYPFTFYLDACQLELASAASAFTTSGPKRYARYTGYIERYPQTWVDAGFRGVKPLEAVDALSVLSRTVINQAYKATVLSDNPVFYMPLSDQSAPQQVLLPQGGEPMLGYTSLGTNGGAANFQGDTFLDGSPAVRLTQQNVNPPVNGNAAYTTYLGSRSGSIAMLPANGFTFDCWIKFTAGTAFVGVGSFQSTDSLTGQPGGPAIQLSFYTSFGALYLHYGDPNGGGQTPTFLVFGPFRLPNGAAYFPDGQWHYVALGLFGSNMYTSIDGQAVIQHSALGFTPSQAILLNDVYMDVTTNWGDPVSDLSVANFAAYQTLLTNAQVAKHYARGSGNINELSGARVARLLAQYWSTTNYSAATGYIALAPDFNYDPVANPAAARTMLDVLQEISTTESGFIYTNVSGAVVWEDRTTRVAQQTPIATIGQGNGQIHYETIEYDYDPTYVYSQVNLARPANSVFAPQVNATSQAAYGQRILSATLQVNTDFDLNQAAIFYLNRYANPGGAPGTGVGPRIRKLVLNPSKDASMWAFILGLELSQRVTARFIASTGLLMSFDYYVEYINEAGDPASGTYEVQLQLSPVFVPNAWILGDSTYGVLGTTTIPVY